MRVTLLLLCTAAACGGGEDGTSHEGIYQVSTWTQNPTACDVEGPSVAAQREPFFYVKNENFLGQTFVNVNGCNDASDCATQANDEDTIHLGMFGFEEGSDKAGWRTRNAFAFAIQGQCEGGVTETVLTITSSGFRIEQKHFPAVPFPASTGEDDCPDEKVEQAAAGQPCDELEVVTATFTADY